MAFLTKGTTFSIQKKSDSTGSPTVISGLMEVPSLGGTPNKVDITTLDSASIKTMNGLLDFGELAFKFIYEIPTSASESNFNTLRDFEGELCEITIGIPDGGDGVVDTTASFDADVKVSLDGYGVDAPLTFTCNCGLQSDITIE